MKLRVFWEGCADDAKEFEGIGQHAAALKFVETHNRPEKRYGGVLQVEPIDDEAKKTLPWDSDDEGQFKLFEARPTVTWTVYAEHRR